MAFLMLLFLSLAILSSVELRNSTQALERSKAEENALLAVAIALGELQTELGPDQRINAPGGQLLAEGDTSARKHWVGVYESWPDSETERPEPIFRRWLISGHDSAVENLSSAATETIELAEDTVALVPAEYDSDGNLVNKAVEAGVVTIEDRGAYAWWVGDENAKAKIGHAIAATTDAQTAIGRLQATPRAAHEFLLNEDIPADSSLLDRLLSQNQLGIDDFGVDLRRTPYRHDYSFTSAGLLTNVRAGGLRKDLSLYLQQPLSDFTATLAEEYEPLYSVNGKGGFRWIELWRDFNVWGEIEYLDSPPAHEDGNPIASGTPFFVAQSTPNEAGADPFAEYKYPTKLKTTLVFSLVAEEINAGTANAYYDLYVVVDPVFTIWNPNNIALRIPTSTIITFKTWAPPYDLTIRLREGTINGTFSRSIASIFSHNFHNAELGANQDLVLRPGEVQIRSQNGTAIESLTADNVRYPSSLGYDFAAGFKKRINYINPAANRDGSHSITYRLTPSTDPNVLLGYGLYRSDYYYGWPNTARESYSLGAHIINASSGPDTLPASQFPDVFPSIEEDISRSVNVKELAESGEKWPLAAFSFGIKTELDTQFSGLAEDEQGTRMTGRSMLRFNPTTVSLNMFELQAGALRSTPLQIGMRRVSSSLEILQNAEIECDADGLGYYGASYGANDGNSYVIARSIADEPVHSLGAMQQFLPDGKQGSNSQSLQPSIQQAIGNSFATSLIASDVSSAIVDGIDFADHSYLANQVLWDDYFFSSIDPETTTAHNDESTAYAEQRSRFEQFVGANNQPYATLPNSRYLPFTEDSDAALDMIFDANGPRVNAYREIAAMLMVDGMFNVNSTSVAAWKSVLAGLKDASMPVRPANASRSDVTLEKGGETDHNTIVAGLLTAGGGEIPEAALSDPKTPEQWTGFRVLTDTQIDELARAIVAQVRLRGPFLSLADFVNRRLSTDEDIAVSGAIQSALDDSSVSINTAYRQGERSLSLAEATAYGYAFPAAEAGPKSVGAPGYVDQADILTPLAPLLSARSDTFTIRAYGDSRDLTGRITARAYCEAVVQRIPDYVDDSDENHEAAESTTNQILGRKFHILSFRFLGPDDVS